MVNSVIGMVGIAMIMYALWLIRVWQRQMDDFPLGDDDPVPWCASLVYSEIFLCGCVLGLLHLFIWRFYYMGVFCFWVNVEMNERKLG